MELDFRDYMSLKEFFKSIYYRNISIENAEMKQDEFNVVLNALKTYSPKNPKYIKDKINCKMEGMWPLMHLKSKYFHFIMKAHMKI